MEKTNAEGAEVSPRALRVVGVTLLSDMGLRYVGLVFALLLGRAGWGQIDAHAMEHELKGKPMALRSYSAEPVARYEWVADKFVSVPGHSFTLGVFTTRSVKLKGNMLIFEGTRGTLVRDARKGLLGRTGDVPMKLEIDLRNAPTTLSSPMVETMVFFEDAAKAIAGLPMPLSEMLPLNTTGVVAAKCDCTRIFDGGQWIKLAHNDPQTSHPKLKFSVEPKFSEEARNQKVSGGVVAEIYVDNTGHVGDVWIGRGVGLGLDEKAVAAARQYVFEPAMYEGRPVGTELAVEINFQIF
jgi:TonB family protein